MVDYLQLLVEGPIVEETFVERFANKKTIVEGSVAENTVIEKMEIDLTPIASFIFRLFNVFPFP